MWGPVLLSLSILVSADGGLASPDTGPPTGSPQCFSSLSPSSSSELLLLCSWPGGHPEPTLLWKEDNTKPAGLRQQLNVSRRTDNLVVTMNSTGLYDGQTFKCVGWHPELQDTTEKACAVTLRAPYPVGYPLVTGFAKHNVTLSCSDQVSNPPAKITWMRKEEIRNSSKYVISQVGPVSSLTIVNCSKDTDEGIYFCKTENPLLREMEVYLTIKISASNSGGLIAAIISTIIIIIAVVIFTVLYQNRHRVFLGNYFGNEDHNEVLVLVDTDDEISLDDNKEPERQTSPASGSINLQETKQKAAEKDLADTQRSAT
ncbi:V-set and immunoglobulin domain-containing protein 10 isoform X1 [Polypterus senegalus]|uniref:V-set and immunoglobulin domain-containing protein 10 isoform X1 n=1 Tax=Polypterus senegalus TaxID=55291 RepID=UPI0019669126|nr:V-set and immunoglobulin domain-containing protein 10 isoform X1 [Polypterus senegalus]